MTRFLLTTIVLFTAVFFSSCEPKEPMVLIKTNKGDIKIKLYNETPQHRDNFLKLVETNYLDSTLFHRVIPEFMIQGGDPDSRNAQMGQRLGQGGPEYTIPREFSDSLFHKKGALSAARKPDQVNPEQASSGSQFYLVVGKTYTDAELDQIQNGSLSRIGRTMTPEQREVYKTQGGTPFLDGGYTVFGEVVEGIELAVQISLVPRDRSDRPNEDVRMLSLEIVK